MKTFLFAAPVAALLALCTVACDPLANCLSSTSCKDDDDGKDGKSDADASEADKERAAAAAAALMCVTGGKSHKGLGGEELAAKNDGPVGGDRSRVKPFSALSTEYGRVLGSTPPSVKSAGPTFGIAGDRWFLEPIASAVFVNKAFDVAFEGCSDLVENDPKFSAKPTTESAHDACTEWTQKFWSRQATPEQLDACTAAATEATERPWAYACASVLTATPFLTY